MLRNILLAVDFSEESDAALRWTVHDLYRKGDSLHLLHISKCLSPQSVILHTFPGASYTIPDPKPISEEAHAQQVRQALKDRFGSLLDSMRVTYCLHIYLDTENAPASAIGDTICKVGDTVDAGVIAVATHDKSGWDTFLHGSVTDYCSANSSRPLVVVRNMHRMPMPTVPPGAVTTGPTILEHFALPASTTQP